MNKAKKLMDGLVGILLLPLIIIFIIGAVVVELVLLPYKIIKLVIWMKKTGLIEHTMVNLQFAIRHLWLKR